MSIGKGYLFRAYDTMGSQTPALTFRRHSKSGKRVRNLYSGKDRESFRYAPVGVCWPGEAVSRLTKIRASVVINFGYIFDFSLVGSILETGSKILAILG